MKVNMMTIMTKKKRLNVGKIIEVVSMMMIMMCLTVYNSFFYSTIYEKLLLLYAQIVQGWDMIYQNAHQQMIWLL